MLYSPFDKKYFFRVYSEDKHVFEDFDLCAEDIEIVIVDPHVVLRSDGESSRIDWSDKVLGRPSVVEEEEDDDENEA